MSQTPGLDSDFERLLERLQREGVKPGLEATRGLLDRLGRPHERLSVVLISGTNGKGSTATLLASFAEAAGYSTGLYTSPHLESPRERIRIGGRAVSAAQLDETIREIVATPSRTPTYFEAMTISAFLLFSRRNVDLAVVEVGLGGRLDATNVAHPILSLVTSVGLDHMEYLGSDLGQIAREKAGIFRPGRPAVSGVASGPAREAIEAEAERVGATYLPVDDDTAPMSRSLVEEPTGRVRQRVDLSTTAESYSIETSLLGAHQAENLRLAVVAAEQLREQGWDRFDRAAVERGGRSGRWPGRLESIERPDRPGRVLLDIAHNPDGIERLRGYLIEREVSFVLLFGALADKPAEEMLVRLAELAEVALLTRPESPRAWWPGEGELSERPDIVREREPLCALDRALARSSGLVVVCGSIFLVGPVRAELARRWPTVVVSAAACDVTGGVSPPSRPSG